MVKISWNILYNQGLRQVYKVVTKWLKTVTISTGYKGGTVEWE
jgi:hypothetical protein